MPLPNEVELLLIDDNPSDVALALRALERHNLVNKVHVERDGAAALNYIFAEGGAAEAHSPKVIFLDLKLPKVDGLEVLRRLKGDERTRMIPVVVLTSSREEQDVVSSYQLGVNSYIVKPFAFENFTQAVSELGMYWLLLNRPPG